LNEKYNPLAYDPLNEPFFQRIRLRRMYSDPVPWEYYLHDDEDQHDYLTESVHESMVEPDAVSPRFSVKTSLNEPFGRICIRDACTQTAQQQLTQTTTTFDLREKENNNIILQQKPVQNKINSIRKKKLKQKKKVAKKKVPAKDTPIRTPLGKQTVRKSKPLHPLNVNVNSNVGRVQYHEDLSNIKEYRYELPDSKQEKNTSTAKQQELEENSTLKSESVTKVKKKLVVPKKKRRATAVLNSIENFEMQYYERPDVQSRRIKRKPPVPVQPRRKRIENSEEDTPENEEISFDNKQPSDQEEVLNDISFISSIDESIQLGDARRQSSTDHSEKTDTQENISILSIDTNQEDDTKLTETQDLAVESSNSLEESKEHYQNLERKFRESMLRVEQSRKRSEWIDKYIHLLVPPNESVAKVLNSTLLSSSSSVTSTPRSSKHSGRSSPALLSTTSTSSSKQLGESQIYLEDISSSSDDTDSDDNSASDTSADDSDETDHSNSAVSTSFEELISNGASSDLIDKFSTSSKSTAFTDSQSAISKSTTPTTAATLSSGTSNTSPSYTSSRSESTTMTTTDTESSFSREEEDDSSLLSDDSTKLEELEQLLEKQHQKLMSNGFITDSDINKAAHSLREERRSIIL
jgi:hypothetical protein